jgi:ubiquinone/menaquinone biosynthesis C-methylase UbiE
MNFSGKFDKDYYSSGGYKDYLKKFERVGFVYAKRLVKVLKPKKYWKFLDVGCGMGGVILALRKMGYKAFGTEISEFCLKNSPAKKWMVFGDICKLPFQDNSFDVVLSLNTICYLTKKEAKKALKELARVSKRFLYIKTINKGSPESSKRKNPDPLRKNRSLLKKREIVRLLKKEGFKCLGPLFKSLEKIKFNRIFVKIK